MPDQDDLDRLLDSALSSYAEPAPDLEQRILHSLAASDHAPAARRHAWLPSPIAIPAAACLLVALGLWIHPWKVNTGNSQQAQKALEAAHAAPAESAAKQPAQTVSHHRRSRSVSRPVPAYAALPKREVFPTPQPLSPAEQAFVKYVAMAPEKERRALLLSQAQQNAPLEISAIKISPITIPDPSGNQGEP